MRLILRVQNIPCCACYDTKQLSWAIFLVCNSTGRYSWFVFTITSWKDKRPHPSLARPQKFQMSNSLIHPGSESPVVLSSAEALNCRFEKVVKITEKNAGKEQGKSERREGSLARCHTQRWPDQEVDFFYFEQFLLHSIPYLILTSTLIFQFWNSSVLCRFSAMANVYESTP